MILSLSYHASFRETLGSSASHLALRTRSRLDDTTHIMEWIDAASPSPTGARSASPSSSYRAAARSRGSSPGTMRGSGTRLALPGSGSSRLYMSLSTSPQISPDERRALASEYTPQNSIRRGNSPPPSQRRFWEVHDEIEKRAEDVRKREATRLQTFLLEKEEVQEKRVRQQHQEHRREYLTAQKEYQDRRDKKKHAERQAERDRVDIISDAIRREESLAIAVASPHVSPTFRRPPASPSASHRMR